MQELSTETRGWI